MRSFGFLAIAAMAAFGPALAHAQTASSSLTAGSMVTYSEGEFGTGQNTQIWYVPTFVQYKNGPLRLKATVPYIAVKNQGAVVSGGTVIGNTEPGTETTTRGGLGDIWLDARYTVRGTQGMPDLVPYAKVKFGTASASEGLGTGENDYEAGMSFEGVLGSTVFPFATLGYRWIGEPAGVDLRNVATYEAGSSFLAGDRQVITLMFSGRQSAQPGFPAAADAIVAWNYDLEPGSGLQVYVDKGLSEGSPDYSVGIGGQVRF